MRITDEDLEQDTLEEQIESKDALLRAMVYGVIVLAIMCFMFFIILISIIIGNQPIT